ncbi:Uu.00g016240.m01.CDS01 [Anthostomella pinea]|uniref:Uu.00g016240.m01.CDS01 n=1 Tax=Anthostomella pinea TaxID=933095 RepID=A0AAI8YQI4_9PEZI|nr:Uu.00g016240.m01.CDS01 [Anthostomella pinea]
MESKKTFATAESTSVVAAFFDMDPQQPGRRTTASPAGSHSIGGRSHSSLRSQSQPRASTSCVSRDASGGDCAHQRFIVWAAVKRNRSLRMAASERLSCPLLRCGERFHDHEKMLRHLAKCQHLTTGEYVCYECMKVERFNDSKCSCCLGHPTKRRRIVNIAKNFFSNIGSKSRRHGSSVASQTDHRLPPPSYDSLVVDTHHQYEQQELWRSQQQRRQWDQQWEEQEHQQPQLELNGTELLELDSTPLSPPAQLDAINYDTPHGNSSNASQVPPPPLLVQSTEVFTGKQTPSHIHDAMPPPKPGPSNSGGSRPSLALITSMDHFRSVPRPKYLSPRSSLRSMRSSHGVSPITPWSANSVSTGEWTMNSSIDTGMTSPATPFSAGGYPMEQQSELSYANAKDMSACPEDSCHYTLGNVSELPGDDPLSLAVPRGLSDPLFFSFDPKDNYSWMSSVDTEISLGTSVNMMFTNDDARPVDLPSEFLVSPVSASDTKTLVGSAWEAVQEHISSSMSKLTQLQGNPLADRLQTQLPQTVALGGLSSLKRILNGNDPTDPLDYLNFVHLMYAFSLVIHEDHLITRYNKFYDQALAYKGFFSPAYVDMYTQIAITLWQPSAEQQPRQPAGVPLSRSSSLKGKEPECRKDPRTAVGSDPLVVTGQNFLDDIENSVIASDTQRSMEVLTSELWSAHVTEMQPDTSRNNPFAITSNYIIQVLSQNFHDSQSLLPRLRVIGQRVHAGYIATVRKLELEVLQAGKDSLASSDLFDEFIPQVRGLCDPIYSQQGFSPRKKYHALGISLVETLLRSITRESYPTPEQTSASQMNLPDPFDEFLRGLDKTFDPDDEFLMPMDTGASVHEPMNPGNQSDFDPTVDPTALQRLTSTDTSKPLTIRASRPETSTEPFAGSIVSSPDRQRATTAPSPSISTTSAWAEGARGDDAGPSSSSASGSKIEANDCCELCGYRPKGDPQWFKGSMAKHKKMQHSTNPPVIYRCPYPGCNSQYKNRQDNLRQHQIEKNHFVGDEATRRPSKRKKVSQDQ